MILKFDFHTWLLYTTRLNVLQLMSYFNGEIVTQFTMEPLMQMILNKTGAFWARFNPALTLESFQQLH